MIKQMNSKELMDEIDRTVDAVDKIRYDLLEMERQIETKLAIINIYENVANTMLASLQDNIIETGRNDATIIFGLDLDNTEKVLSGSYSYYGQTIHPKFVRLPDQVCNFITGDNMPLFKDNATVSFINDGTEDYQYEYCNILRDEADPAKQDVFKQFDNNMFTLAVQMLPSKLVGNSQCNMIEIDPYLPGTFDIRQIRIWTMQQYLSQDMTVPDYTSNVEYLNVGPQRIILDTTYQLYRIEFDIELHMPAGIGNYFGLRHLYFYHAAMDRENSYIILRFKKDRYITSPGNSMTIQEVDRTITRQLEEYRWKDETPCPEYYMIYENNTLQSPLSPNSNIARNITEFYVRFPVFNAIRSVSANDIDMESAPEAYYTLA